MKAILCPEFSFTSETNFGTLGAFQLWAPMHDTHPHPLRLLPTPPCPLPVSEKKMRYLGVSLEGRWGTWLNPKRRENCEQLVWGAYRSAQKR